MAGTLRTPAQTESLQYIRPRPELTSKQSFRSPIEDAEDVSELNGQGGYGYRMGPSGYDYGKQPQMYYSSQPYPPMAGQPPMQQYPGSIPSMTPNYLQTNLQTAQLGQDRPQYTQYDQNAYGRTMPPTSAASIPTSLPDRNQQSMYPPATISRPISTLSPVSMDSRSSIAYRPNSYGSIPSITSPTDAHRPPQQSPVGTKFEDRRDHQQPVASPFPNAGQSYYGSSQMNTNWNGPPQQ